MFSEIYPQGVPVDRVESRSAELSTPSSRILASLPENNFCFVTVASILRSRTSSAGRAWIGACAGVYVDTGFCARTIGRGMPRSQSRLQNIRLRDASADFWRPSVPDNLVNGTHRRVVSDVRMMCSSLPPVNGCSDKARFTPIRSVRCTANRADHTHQTACRSCCGARFRRSRGASARTSIKRIPRIGPRWGCPPDC